MDLNAETTIARVSRPGRSVRVAFGLFLAIGITLAVIGHIAEEPEIPWLGIAVAALAIWLLLAFIGRNIEAVYWAKPRVDVSPRGIFLRVWPSYIFTGLFLPYHRMTERLIPWADYKGCRVFTQTVNGIKTGEDLIIVTTTGEITISRGTFDLTPKRLQTAILDYLELKFWLPQREAARLAEFQRKRFTVPFILDYFTVKLWMPLVVLGLTIAAPIMVMPYLATTDEAGVKVLCWIVGGLICFWLARRWWRDRGMGHVELRTDGLVLAERSGLAPAVPWEQVLIVREHTMASSFMGSKAGPPVIEAIEVRLADGRSRVIRGNRGRLRQLHSLLAPQLELVQQAHALIAQGRDAEQAATAVGLPGR